MNWCRRGPDVLGVHPASAARPRSAWLVQPWQGPRWAGACLARSPGPCRPHVAPYAAWSRSSSTSRWAAPSPPGWPRGHADPGRPGPPLLPAVWLSGAAPSRSPGPSCSPAQGVDTTRVETRVRLGPVKHTSGWPSGSAAPSTSSPSSASPTASGNASPRDSPRRNCLRCSHRRQHRHGLSEGHMIRVGHIADAGTFLLPGQPGRTGRRDAHRGRGGGPHPRSRTPSSLASATTRSSTGRR